MRMKWLVTSAIILGIIMGAIWFAIGEVLDNYLGNFIAWFIAPIIIPFILSMIIFFIDKVDSIKKSILFFVIEYISHWIPFVVFLLIIWFYGGM